MKSLGVYYWSVKMPWCGCVEHGLEYIMFYVKQGKSEGFESCDRPIVRKRPIWVKIGDVLSRVTLKFDGWPWKTIGHLSFAVSSFVQHFIAIGEFKLELQSGNAQFGSNLTIFRAVWPWNLTDDLEKQQGTSSMLLQALCIISEPLGNSKWSYSPETTNLGQIRWFLEPCDLEIWRMTLKNNRAPLQCCFKHCASFRKHWCIQTWVRVRKRPI